MNQLIIGALDLSPYSPTIYISSTRKLAYVTVYDVPIDIIRAMKAQPFYRVNFPIYIQTNYDGIVLMAVQFTYFHTSSISGNPYEYRFQFGDNFSQFFKLQFRALEGGLGRL
jgi:hypothetical protein